MTSSLRQLRLPPMPKISEIMRLYGIRAKKQLSQNFILDLNVTDKMSRCADVFDCHVIEVGAGPGSLTRSLINGGIRHLHAVELDERFLPSLEILQEASQGGMTIHHNDILKFDMTSVLNDPSLEDPIAAPWDSDELPNIRLVGNLPFDVSIPLLLQWIEAISRQKGPWRFGRVPMTLVFQKEVGQNMIAEDCNYDRSRLAIMTQNYCHVTRPMVLNSTVFTPQPKVDAWLMHFIPRWKPIIDAPFDIVEQVVKGIFQKRKKVIRTPMKLLFPGHEHLAQELLENTQIEPTLRAHQLSVEQYGEITSEFMRLCKVHDLSTTPLKVNKPSLIVDNLP